MPAPERGRKAHLLLRGTALILDAGIGVVFYFAGRFGLGALAEALGVLWMIALLGGYVGWFLLLLRRGRTPGKQLLSLQVIDVRTGEVPGLRRMFLREVPARLLSALPFGLGFARAIRDPEGRAWHDRLARTLVLKVGR